MTIPEALTKIISKIDPFWTDRVWSMLTHSCVSRNGAFHSEVSNLRVNPEWPSRGSITMIRGDGKRVRLYMTKRDGFKIKITSKQNKTNA